MVLQKKGPLKWQKVSCLSYLTPQEHSWVRFQFRQLEAGTGGLTWSELSGSGPANNLSCLSPGLYFVDPASVFLFSINHNRWLDVGCAELSAPSFQQEEAYWHLINAGATHWFRCFFSTPATLNMDLSEHRGWARNERPDWCSLYQPKVSDRMPAASVCTPAALALSKANEALRPLRFNHTLAGLWTNSPWDLLVLLTQTHT